MRTGFFFSNSSMFCKISTILGRKTVIKIHGLVFPFLMDWWFLLAFWVLRIFIESIPLILPISLNIQRFYYEQEHKISMQILYFWNVNTKLNYSIVQNQTIDSSSSHKSLLCCKLLVFPPCQLEYCIRKVGRRKHISSN